MSQDWLTVALRDVVSEDRERVAVEAGVSYPIVGVLIAGRGLFWREPVNGSVTKYMVLYRIRAQQLVYRKLTAWEGPITIVQDEYDGAFVSAEFPTFTLDQSQILPEFLRLICQQPSFHDQMRMRSTGTAERRNRLAPDELLDIEVELPPIRQQRAIIDVIQGLEAHEAAARSAAQATEAVLAIAREHLLQRIEDLEPLRAVVERFEAGVSPKCLNRPPVDDEWAVLKTSAVRPGWFRPSEAKALPPDVTPRIRAEVRDGDVLTIRASGSRRLVGAFCRVRSTPPRRLLSDYHWRVRISDERIDPDYLVEAMAGSEARSQIEDATTGSTTAGKVSQASMLEVEIPLPASLDQQRELVATLRPLEEAAAAYAHEAAAAAHVKTAALDELLSRERELSV